MKQNALFFLLWISWSGLFGQSSAQCMEIARQQIELNNDTSARKILQRVIFFDRKTYGTECYELLGAINFRLANYAQSEFYYDLLFQNVRTDSLRTLALYGKIGALILQDKYRQARLELLNLPASNNPEAVGKKHLFMGACYFGERNFDKAEQELMALIPPENVAEKKEFQRLMEKARHYNRKNPNTAKWLSIFVPGLGQLYAGDYRNGINSMLLNALTATWFVFTAVTISLPDAGMSVGSWLLRYYAGGYKRAPVIVEEKKKERLDRSFQKMLPLLQKS